MPALTYKADTERIYMELPQKYLDSMKELLGDEFQAYLDSFSQKRLYGLRVNNLKISTEDFLKICPFKFCLLYTSPSPRD